MNFARPPSPKPRSWLRRATLVLSLATCGCILAAWGVLALAVDRTWFGTVLAFGPRWVLLAPVLALLPAAALLHRPAAALLMASGAIVVGPVMDARCGWPKDAGGDEAIRVMTFNLGGQQEFSRLLSIIEREQPAVVACQEWPAGASWPLNAPAEWHVAEHGGLLIASKFPLTQIGQLQSPTDAWRTLGVACELQTNGAAWRCVCLHLPTARSGLEAVVQRGLGGRYELNAVNRLRGHESRLTAQWAQSQQAAIVLGDFNMPQESRLYASDWSPWHNAFGSAGRGFGWTKRTRTIGVRIDHVLAGPQWHCTRAWIGGDAGSDHRPLLATLVKISR
jgi:endonuclease/exonuclease/phosphatase (EEP) superfamily protein YafD